MNEQQWARSCPPKSPPQLSKDRELWEVGGETEALRGLTCLESSVIQVARGQGHQAESHRPCQPNQP